MTGLTPWIFACLVHLSHVLYPGQDASEARLRPIAVAIDEAAREWPLAERDGGGLRMAVELAALSATEGHLDVNAIGTDDAGASLGILQIHQSTLAYLHATPADCFDVDKAMLLGARLVYVSHGVCSAMPRGAALGWYASGSNGCQVPEGIAASITRMRLADETLRAVPVFWVEPREVLTKRRTGA